MAVSFFVQQRTKFVETDAKAMKARNDYILGINSANAVIHKFIVDDLPELINVFIDAFDSPTSHRSDGRLDEDYISTELTKIVNFVEWAVPYPIAVS